MTENLVVLSFVEESKAYQAFSELKLAATEGHIALINAVVLRRDAAGNICVRDGWADGGEGSQVLGGTLLGAMVGFLLGPLGVLLGATAGTIVGLGERVEDIASQGSLIDQIAAVVPPGVTAVIATVDEETPSVVDDLAHSLNAIQLRRPLDAVQAEVDARSAAEEAAARAARKVLFEQRKTEWRDRIAQWQKQASDGLAQLKERIGKALST